MLGLFANACLFSVLIMLVCVGLCCMLRVLLVVRDARLCWVFVCVLRCCFVVWLVTGFPVCILRLVWFGWFLTVG